jgi:hypothetical protein
MGVNETYNARVAMQANLDELFPRGAYVTVVEDLGVSALQPTGIEITTGRVFCSDAVETKQGWQYQLFVDPRRGEQENGQYEQPFTAWVDELDVENHPPMAEARILPQEDDEPLQVIRLRNDPQGPRSIGRGVRAFLTDLRESELFPYGLQEMMP